jgi:hypothetical protein
MNMMVSAAAMTAAASIPAAAEVDPAFAAIKVLQATKEGLEAAVAEEIRRTRAADEQIPLPGRDRSAGRQRRNAFKSWPSAPPTSTCTFRLVENTTSKIVRIVSSGE